MRVLVIFLLTLFVATGCRITSIEGETDDVEIKVNSKGMVIMMAITKAKENSALLVKPRKAVVEATYG